MTLYIPFVLKSISGHFIKHVFHRFRIGKVAKVVFVPKTGEHVAYNAACVYFDCWFNNRIASNLQLRIKNPSKIAKLIYDDPSYWVLCEYETTHVSKPKPKPSKLNPTPNTTELFFINRLLRQHQHQHHPYRIPSCLFTIAITMAIAT